MSKERNTAEKYWWVYDHPSLRPLPGREPFIDMTPHMVCPETNRVENDQSRDTQIAYWIEVIPYKLSDEFKGKVDNLWTVTNDMTNGYHEYDLDCGGWSACEAIEKLYKLTLDKFGEYDESISDFDRFPPNKLRQQ